MLHLTFLLSSFVILLHAGQSRSVLLGDLGLFHPFSVAPLPISGWFSTMLLTSANPTLLPFLSLPLLSISLLLVTVGIYNLSALSIKLFSSFLLSLFLNSFVNESKNPKRVLQIPLTGQFC